MAEETQAMIRRLVLVCGLDILTEPMLSRANTPAHWWLAVGEAVFGSWLVAFALIRGGRSG